MDILSRWCCNSKQRIVADLCRVTDFRSAKLRLLSSDSISDEEKAMLRRVPLGVSHADAMYEQGRAQHYLLVGLSAIHCIENALVKSGRAKSVQSILDFPSGYGRVLRFLKVRFPDAHITACEINASMLDYCKRVFSVKTAMSHRDFNLLSLTGKFDLIWSGSLLTHIDRADTTDLLSFFCDHLAPDGLCVFTTHGQTSVDWIRDKRETYGLSANAQQQVLSQFDNEGYGYADYPNVSGIGVSVVSYDRMMAIARDIGPWKATCYLERGWDNHQDVYAFTLAEPTGASKEQTPPPGF